ncbi:MAG: M15 family metallopeptidase [Myxococcota bacterium]
MVKVRERLGALLLVTGMVWGASASSAGGGKAQPADLVDATQLVPDLVLDMRYATENNFLKRKLYSVGRCLLRRHAAEQLKRAADALREKGFRVVAWDCYRPHSVQKLMWEAVPRRGYVAPPQPGSVHNRGGAVDVSLADLQGKHVPMPTDFDDFTTRANLHSMNHPKDVMQRRQVLRDAFEGAGFTGIRSEWWHFEASGARQFPVLDVPLEDVP